MRYSVIIPAYNRAEQLPLTLASFNLQTFSKEKFEVIVVDDGSTDQTKKVVKKFEASYPLIYSNTEKKSGRSYARNHGISLARGKYVIFCDADFIVIPEFLEIIHKYHKRYPKTVVSGIPGSWNRTYVQYYPEFTEKQKWEMHEVLKPLGLWQDTFWGSEKNIVSVLKPEDLYHRFHDIGKYVYKWSTGSREARKAYRETDVASWLLLVTRCVSIKKRDLLRVGCFEEKFIRYGLEDWELGYRLYQKGLSFVSIKKRVGFHQEHPRTLGEEGENLDINLRIIYQKFGFLDPELNLLSVSPPWKNTVRYKNKLRELRDYEAKGRIRQAHRLREKWRRKAIEFYNN
ncbi:glycosyltransferase family 2 protein [Ammoniphilus sp. CFH 90114]|uniref:glycosyltransferase family 2 protein n=1 Tax=Ammoniphilus sp. CFH 90114 TaxID=2493665 RepID=UPI00100F29BE|nr:glycosyltransferase family 2 protein [Ammoniphilus sp. CFH 90114]RXT13987.1 glycosyltransferase family 2 protein [Ammoniphilus sp. CFH 90114]